MATEYRYPARLNAAEPEESLSRWLWLVKWLLVIPHVVVLAFLWLGLIVTTVISGIAILITGHYPRGLFDYAVGVMRWTWRVAYYANSVFATDRYPPFSLADDPSYPATFTVDYPERLSRGLVLIKWWLLALPHLIIVGILAGGWGFGWTGGWRIAGGGGLISILALVAGVILAVTGKYPRQLFDFLMGLNRWCYRVLAYVALLTDQYPPFRLDTGGPDPAGPVTGPTTSVPPVASPTPETVG
jgi:hypothetical protein